MNKKIKEIKAMQQELDRRTEVEKEAEKLITEGKFEEANQLLSSLDKKKEVTETLKELLDKKIKEEHRVTVTQAVWICYKYLKEQNVDSMPLEIIEHIDKLHEQLKIYGS